MISEDIWEKIEVDFSEISIIRLSEEYKIPLSFIVGRLAKLNYITYSSKLYNKYKLI